jgi:hypothetical protein
MQNTKYNGHHSALQIMNIDADKVVLANSTIANANAKDSINLFKALKGGASNFGKAMDPIFASFVDYIQELWWR